jgi:uncharacterized membrane protein
VGCVLVIGVAIIKNIIKMIGKSIVWENNVMCIGMAFVLTIANWAAVVVSNFEFFQLFTH